MTYGSIFALIVSGVGIAVYLHKLSRYRIFLLAIIACWLFLIGRNAVPYDRHYLIVYTLMLAVAGEGLAVLMSNSCRIIRNITMCGFGFSLAAMCLYTLIFISPFWKSDARILCSEWIKANVPAGSGVTWAPRTHNWMLPGLVVDPSLFEKYPRIAEKGKDQYILAARGLMQTFKSHPPSKPIDPKEWFPANPPSMEELVLYAEMNAGGRPRPDPGQGIYTASEFHGS